MLPSVAEVLRLPSMRSGRPRVVAGADGLSGSVRWVHSTEITDVGRLLRGRDLLLTTGIALPEDDEGIRSHVADLVGADAAGLVVELGRRWTDELPPTMVAACQEANLPLVALRRETRFVAVAEAVGQLVVDSQLEELRAVDHIHRTFTRLSVEGAEIADIVAEVRRLADAPVVLESLGHVVLAYDAGDADLTDLLADWMDRSRSVTPPARTGYEESAGWLVSVVGARGADWGRLVVLVPETPSARLVLLAERAASALALQRLAARDRASLERQSHRALLNALTGPTPHPDDLDARSTALGVPLAGRRLVALVAMPRSGTATGAGQPLAGQDHLRDLAEVAASCARSCGTPALVAVTGDDAVQVLLSLPARAAESRRVDQFAAALHEAVEQMPRPVPTLVAAGVGVGSVDAVGQMVAEARHVADAARRARIDRVCHRLEDVRLRGFLHLLAEDPRLLAFADRELRAIETYDAEHGTHYLDLVRACVEHGANKTAAAAALHLSRAAFYERLGRLETRFGLDLGDAESRASLHVALLAREITARDRTIN